MNSNQDPLDEAVALLKARALGQQPTNPDLEEILLRASTKKPSRKKSVLVKTSVAVLFFAAVGGGVVVAAGGVHQIAEYFGFPVSVEFTTRSGENVEVEGVVDENKRLLNKEGEVIPQLGPVRVELVEGTDIITIRGLKEDVEKVKSVEISGGNRHYNVVIEDKEDTAGLERQRWEQIRELVGQLAENEGYRLEPGKLLKNLQSPNSERRSDLLQLLWQDSWGEVPSKYGGMVFHATPGKDTQLAKHGAARMSLQDALETILSLKRHQLECDDDLLEVLLDGDWVCSWDPRKFRVPTSEEVAAMEAILTRLLPGTVSLDWKEVEEDAVVASGDYQYAAVGKESAIESELAKVMDGPFRIPVRRSDINLAVGSYRQFLQHIGEVLGMTVVDETSSRPTKAQLVWSYVGEPLSDQGRLGSADEQAVLNSLSKQTGFQFVQEKRPVHKLFIEVER